MKCPRCGSARVVEIVWGLVGWDVGQRAERGEVWIAGCDVPPDPPEWHCQRCGFEF